MNDMELNRLFDSALNEDLPATDFAAAVVRRLRRRLRIRTLILGVAAATGLAIAIVPLAGLAAMLIDSLAQGLAAILDSSVGSESFAGLALLTLAAASPLAMRLFVDD